MNLTVTAWLSAVTIVLAVITIADTAPATSEMVTFTVHEDSETPDILIAGNEVDTRSKRDVNDVKRKKFFWLTFYHENLKPLMRVLGDLTKIKMKEYTTATTELLQQELVIKLQQLGYFTDELPVIAVPGGPGVIPPPPPPY